MSRFPPDWWNLSNWANFQIDLFFLHSKLKLGHKHKHKHKLLSDLHDELIEVNLCSKPFRHFNF